MRPIEYTMIAVLMASCNYNYAQQISERSEGLTIVAHEGAGGTNILENNAPTKLVVEIRDIHNVPVSGASVTFVLPSTGPRAVFFDGKSVVSLTTATDGRVTLSEIRPIDIGKFDINVRAEYMGRSGAATITQTNVATNSDAKPSGAPVGGRESASFKIEILEGDDGVNIIDKKTAVRTVVRVVDKNNLPVAAVPVTVTLVILAKRGPRVEFPNGKSAITLKTNLEGRAEVSAARPEGTGTFRIQIKASHMGRTIATTIAQTNFPTETAALENGKTPGHSSEPRTVQSSIKAAQGLSTKAIVVLAGVATAGAVGGVVGLKGGGTTPAPARSGGIPIQIGGPGTPAIGPPR